jgi:hypothetical protein
MQRLDGSTTLPTGQRLRLRMPHALDGPRVRDLFARLGVATDDLALSRALRFDPRERVAVVATVLAGRSDELVGFASMRRHAMAPELVLADEDVAPGATAILEQTLRAHGERTRRSA